MKVCADGEAVWTYPAERVHDLCVLQNRKGIKCKDTMKHVIHDLHKLTKAPQMPVVAGATSALGDGSLVAHSQMAVARIDEFKDAVATVDTRPYYPTVNSLPSSI